MTSRRRSLRALAAGLLVLLVVAPLALARRPGPARCSYWSQVEAAVFGGESWVSIPAPSYPAGGRTVTSYGISATNPEALLVTNGTSVMRSTDGGCSWKQSFTLPSSPSLAYPYSAATATITKVVPARFSEEVAYLLVQDRASRVHAVVTTNWGNSWRSADAGLETAIGANADIAPFASNTEFAYLTAGDGTGTAVYATEDTGGAWQPRRTKVGTVKIDPNVVPPDVTVEPRLDNLSGVEVDPFDWNDLWFPSPNGLYRSRDGGRDVARVQGVPAEAAIGVVDLYRDFAMVTNAARVLGFTTGSTAAYRSDNGGRDFYTFRAPGVVQSASNAVNKPTTAVATDKGVFLLIDDIPAPMNVVQIASRSALVDVQGAQAIPVTDEFSVYTFYARTDTTIERYVGKVRDAIGDGTQLADIDVALSEIELQNPAIAPKKKKVVLDEGESKKVPYSVSIPQNPEPLDVYFLVDISESMADAINGVRAAMQDIVDQLGDANINVYFGVGEYRSFTDEPAYHRILPISPPGSETAQALNSLDADGGGDETQTEAIYQAATGEGRDFVEPVGLPQKQVEAGQQAGFREDSLRVILHMTDEEISQGCIRVFQSFEDVCTGYHRSFEEASRVLLDHDILHLGLAIQEGTGAEETTPRYGLERISRGSGAVAPRGGVDCDGNGSADIATGSPLVCVIDPDQAYEARLMAPAIVNLLRAVEDPAEVALETTAPPGIVEEVDPESITNVNFATDNKLDFDVTYTCPRIPRDKSYPVDIVPTVDGEQLTKWTGEKIVAEATVVCKNILNEITETAAQPLIPIVLPPIVPPPPRPPDIVTNPNPQPQGQAQANAAMAQQEEEQHQVAFAHASTKAEEVAAAAKAEEKYAMSSLRKDDRGVPPEAVLMIGAATMSMMFGCATLARERVRTQPARVRR